MCTEPDKEMSSMRKCTKDNNDSRYTGKWKHDEPVPLEQQVEQSEQAIKSLKRHLERKTCPKSLLYGARARIRADILRSNAERDYVEALIRFQFRRTESLRSPLRKEKRIKSSTPTRKGTVTSKTTSGRFGA